jgi:hypothetical protein
MFPPATPDHCEAVPPAADIDIGLVPVKVMLGPAVILAVITGDAAALIVIPLPAVKFVDIVGDAAALIVIPLPAVKFVDIVGDAAALIEIPLPAVKFVDIEGDATALPVVSDIPFPAAILFVRLK